MAKATLTFQNITFTALSNGLCSVGSISRQNGDGNRVRVSGNRIKNNGTGHIEVTVGDPANYPGDADITPLGFALVETTNYGDQDGRNNFDTRSHSEGNRTFRMCAQHQNVGGVWKIIVMVQHTNGQVGIIDPDMQNDA